jgi:hydroxymethylpyrimidine pyrophosphatase-like HAD family hydrolase
MYRRGLPTIAFSSPDDAAGVQRWLAAQFAAHEPRLACNRNVRLVQIHDALVGKGRVLAELARVWDLAPDEVLAIGDSANDVSMLDGSLGFQCAAPGNADELVQDVVRRAGGYVAQARIGAGVIEVLRYHAAELGTLQFPS